ncbi:DUF4276 family protein [Endozoicomonas acroporae]|uniref:DUF4276 family protein n=1 Tax=Endozoicomonas acroporae TaxID=1701104 RepID=UPI0013D33878|nr:DUF4276 family protein [Endozoicomonas acroporae]
MTPTLVFFLEEPSAREMLKGLLTKLLPPSIQVQYVVFEGKQDLEKRLPIRLRAWQQPNAMFVVMRDQDSGDCQLIKQGLVAKVTEAGHPETLVRIACHELESFYLGDLKAVAEALGAENLARQQNSKKFRNPDQLANPKQELKRLVKNYQQVSGSRAIGPLLDIDNNRSNSFNAFIRGK